MGRALAAATLELGHEVIVISGPVSVKYPRQAELIRVVSTAELLEACRKVFPQCQGLIAAAAPCDYQPIRIEPHKMAKRGRRLVLQLRETPDVVAALGAEKKPGQWLVGFALETEDRRFRALAKLEKKRCDLMVLNGPQAIDSTRNRVEIIDRSGRLLDTLEGPKKEVARGILRVIHRRLVWPSGG
jgi:phosphopantothenoylcysteine decarboxylase/phosphopantothenate--cysteine ligase